MGDLFSKGSQPVAEEPAINTELLIWDPTDNEIGHCALMLDDGTYISFWPGCNFDLKTDRNRDLPSMNNTYEEDVEAERRTPSLREKVQPGEFCNARIKRWWNDNKNNKYHLDKCDCNLTVWNCLVAGDLKQRHGYDLLANDGWLTDRVFARIIEFRLKVSKAVINAALTMASNRLKKIKQ